MSLFIVEDSHVDAALMREMLETEGVRDIQLFPNGEAVLDKIGATGKLPNLLVVDVRLPGMTGIELVRKIKADEAMAHIPAVCISTSALTEEIAAAYKAGVSSYFVKPSNLESYELIASAIHLTWFDHRISRAAPV
ncbi:response regulator [Maricaulaceae bacterium EIL42A08]|nr:response regulator [Maricaulaceae bacterium EIL42A08]